jgi:hypothetical protein
VHGGDDRLLVLAPNDDMVAYVEHRSGSHSRALEKPSHDRELLGVRERVVSRTLELVVLAIDDELIDAVSFVMDGSDIFDQMEHIRPLDMGRGVVTAEDRHER